MNSMCVGYISFQLKKMLLNQFHLNRVLICLSEEKLRSLEFLWVGVNNG